MPHSSRLHTIAFAAITIVFVVTLFGCMVPFYGYPTASCTPLVSVGADGDQVYAFRMDILRTKGTDWSFNTRVGPANFDATYTGTPRAPIYQAPLTADGSDLVELYTPRAKPALQAHCIYVDTDGAPYDNQYTSYSSVPVSAFGYVNPLIRSGMSLGAYVSGIGVEYVAHVRFTVALALYRPGYDLVVVHSWDLLPNVEWKPCSDVWTQALVLDGLFTNAVSGNDNDDDPHVKALRFGASEYDRLALLARQQSPKDVALAATLAEAASKLRKLAIGRYPF